MNVSKIAHFSGHKGSIFSLCAGLHEHTFFSGADDGYVVEWNMATKGDGRLLVQVNRPVYSLFLDREQQLLLCGTASGNLHVIDLNERKEIRNIEAHTLGIFDIQETGDNIITAGGNGSICIWNKHNLELLHTLQLSDKSARVIAVHPHKKEFAVGYSDHHIRIFSTENFQQLFEFKAHTNSVFALSYSPHGNLLYSGGRDVMLKSWNVQQAFENTLDIPAHTLHINAIAFSPNGKLYATVSMDKTIKIWDAQTDVLLKVIDKLRNEGHSTSVNKILWINDEELITCSDDRTNMIWGLR
ncbi:MAG: WD40 repeat domain-containing protein [Bacteroidota bacterium]